MRGPAQVSEGGPPEPAGRPLEAAGNGGPRWMAVTRRPQGPAGTEPGLQAGSSALRCSFAYAVLLRVRRATPGKRVTGHRGDETERLPSW